MPVKPVETNTTATNIELLGELSPRVAGGLAKRLAKGALAGDFGIRDVLDVLGIHAALAAQNTMHQLMQPSRTQNPS